MQKLISSGKEAMTKILQGINLVANPVKSTISPKGRTVVLSQSFVADYGIQNVPIIVSKDGYRISQNIKSSDPEIQVGVLMIQQAIDKQMELAGDGTSTVALLTQALLEGGLKLIDEGASAIEIVKGINAAVEYVVEELKKMSTPINGDVEKIRQVATVCSNNDETIGNLIAEAFSKIGADGVINIEEAKGRETSIKISDGIKFHRGWASQYFVTNRAKAECVLENPYILIYDRPITKMKSDDGSGLLPILEKLVKANEMTGVKRPLMIFSDAIDGEPLATLTFNNAQGNFQACAVEMAFLGDKKREFMEDIAAATGGIFINELKGIKLENVTLGHLGQAKKIVVGKDETVIIEGNKDEKAFQALLQNIQVLEQVEEDLEQKNLLKKRIARLKGAVAILSVGATTEVEMKEKKDRVDDAVRATRSAVEEGYVLGGGLAIGSIILPAHKKEGVERTVFNMMNDALSTPFQQICINASVDINKILSDMSAKKEISNIGYNAKTDKVEDLVTAGIIEPTKSNRCALQNAASVVCQILNSNFMITDTI